MSKGDKLRATWDNCRKIADRLRREFGEYVSSKDVYRVYTKLTTAGFVQDGKLIKPHETWGMVTKNMPKYQVATNVTPEKPAKECDCKSSRSILNMASWYVSKCDTPQQAREFLELAIRAQEIMNRKG